MKLAGAGDVRVIAGLLVRFAPESALSVSGRTAQHRAIDRETDAVRRVLRGTRHRVVRTYETVPYYKVRTKSARCPRIL